MQKFIFFLSIISIVSLFSCQKEAIATEGKSKIVFVDLCLAKCACCGGWNVEIDGEGYKAQVFPEQAPQFEKGQEYYVTWKPLDGPCGFMVVEILTMDAI